MLQSMHSLFEVGFSVGEKSSCMQQGKHSAKCTCLLKDSKAQTDATKLELYGLECANTASAAKADLACWLDSPCEQNG